MIHICFLLLLTNSLDDRDFVSCNAGLRIIFDGLGKSIVADHSSHRLPRRRLGSVAVDSFDGRHMLNEGHESDFTKSVSTRSVSQMGDVEIED